MKLIGSFHFWMLIKRRVRLALSRMCIGRTRLLGYVWIICLLWRYCLKYIQSKLKYVGHITFVPPGSVLMRKLIDLNSISPLMGTCYRCLKRELFFLSNRFIQGPVKSAEKKQIEYVSLLFQGHFNFQVRKSCKPFSRNISHICPLGLFLQILTQLVPIFKCKDRLNSHLCSDFV